MSDTVYSKKIPGTPGNYGWAVRFDKSRGGFLGISQFKSDADGGIERVLLSKTQVTALVAFLAPAKVNRAKKKRSPTRARRST